MANHSRHITLLLSDIPSAAAVHLTFDAVHGDSAVGLGSGQLSMSLRPENGAVRDLRLGSRSIYFAAASQIDTMTLTLPLLGENPIVRGRVTLPDGARLVLLTGNDTMNTFGSSIFMLRCEVETPGPPVSTPAVPPRTQTATQEHSHMATPTVITYTLVNFSGNLNVNVMPGNCLSYGVGGGGLAVASTAGAISALNLGSSLVGWTATGFSGTISVPIAFSSSSDGQLDASGNISAGTVNAYWGAIGTSPSVVSGTVITISQS